jgi:hypothetical protein
LPGGARVHREVVDAVVEPVHLRRRLGRRGDALAHHAQGPHVRSLGRHRGCRYHLAARAARRRAELGLPVLLAARRHLLPAVPPQQRLRRGSAPVGRVVAAGGGRQPGRLPDHVRRRRRAAAHGDRAALAARLRRLSAGARRQRRPRPVPARRLR